MQAGQPAWQLRVRRAWHVSVACRSHWHGVLTSLALTASNRRSNSPFSRTLIFIIFSAVLYDGAAEDVRDRCGTL